MIPNDKLPLAKEMTEEKADNHNQGMISFPLKRGKEGKAVHLEQAAQKPKGKRSTLPMLQEIHQRIGEGKYTIGGEQFVKRTDEKALARTACRAL